MLYLSLENGKQSTFPALSSSVFMIALWSRSGRYEKNMRSSFQKTEVNLQLSQPEWPGSNLTILRQARLWYTPEWNKHKRKKGREAGKDYKETRVNFRAGWLCPLAWMGKRFHRYKHMSKLIQLYTFNICSFL